MWLALLFCAVAVVLGAVLGVVAVALVLYA